MKFHKIFQEISIWRLRFTGSKKIYLFVKLKEIPITDTYKLWVDECAKSFGGMDWLAIDALHGKDGKDYIIELNGSAIGFLPKNWMEDTIHVKELVLQKLSSLFPNK